MATSLTQAQLVSGAKCLNCLSPSERQAAMVIFLALALKAAGGTDYTNANTLIKAAVCFNCAPSDSNLRAYDAEIAQQLALNLGAAANLTIAQIKAQIKLLVSLGSTDLHGLETFLRNALTQFNA